MQNIPEAQWDIWESGDYTGANAVFGEVRISKVVLEEVGVFRTLLFGESTPDVTVPNLQTININRSLQADAATMTFTFLNVIQPTTADNLDNTHGAGSGPTKRQLGDYGFPGAYTFRRGVNQASADRWGHSEDPIWSDMFIPNRLCKTYQGYGSGTLTGIWLIDRVEYKADGQVTVTCRDAAKLLIEQRIYPPIVPVEDYPLKFCVDHETTEYVPTTVESTTGATEAITGVVGANVAYQSPCNGPAGIWDSSGGPYYGCNASVQGHTPAMAFDGNGATYWLSIGNSLPSAGYSFEWLQADCGSEPVNVVNYKPKYGGYKVYVSVMEKEGGVWKWRGDNVIPYDPTHPASAPNGANIPYVMSQNIPVGENWQSFTLPRTYNAAAVRLTFTNLSQTSYPFPYRAGVYEFRVKHVTQGTEGSEGTTTQETIVEEKQVFVPGNITDYVDIVKVLAAWSGFFWPTANSDALLTQWGNQAGRVWGDFQYSGAWPVEPPCIPEDFFDNKSVMDGINQIKEILGYVCYVDSTGGLIFRIPNIWSVGCYVTGRGHIADVRDVDESKVLIDYGVTIDDQNLRSSVTIVSSDDPTLYETVYPGFASSETAPGTAEGNYSDLALLGGQQRIMLVPDYPFLKQEEVRKFAYLISLWIHWSYRKSTFRIPGIAGFEPDDQVRIYERTTSESFLHYIQSVNSTMNLMTGEWYLDIGTHWLGTDPAADWVVNTAEMDPSLFVFLRDHPDDPLGLNVQEDEQLWPPGYEDIVIPDIPLDPYRDDDDLSNLFPEPPPVVYVAEGISGPPGEDGGTDYNPGGGYVASASNQFYYSYWGARGNTSNMIWYKIRSANDSASQVDDVSIRIDSRSVPMWAKVKNILIAEDVKIHANQTSSYNNRYVAGTTTWSVHSWALAVDFNSALNPWHRTITASSYTGAGKFITAMNRCVNEIRANGQRVFRWGGWWNDPDYMHLEVICKASDIAAEYSQWVPE